MNESATNSPKSKRSLVGKVVGNKRDKTVTVLIERHLKHEKYGKYMKRSTKYHAHDEANVYNEGDVVEIQEIRPISKTKNWTVARLVQAVAQV